MHQILCGAGIPLDPDDRTAPAIAGAPPGPEPTQPGHPRLVRWPTILGRIAWLSDIHVPYHDPRAVAAALAVLADFRPNLTVIGGDLYDCYSISRYSKDPDRREALQDEFDAARPILG